MQRREFIKGSVAAGVGAMSVAAAGCAGFSVASKEPSAAMILPVDLRCESLRDPLGVDVTQPRLSWKLDAAAGARNQSQSAYHIRVASTEERLVAGGADVWDSGRIASNQQLHIEYAGPSLETGKRYHWQVEVWDQDGRRSSPSPVAWWEMGLLLPIDWFASWISNGKPLPERDEGYYEDDPAPLFRRSFQVEGRVKRARLYATALGYAEVTLNGENVSDSVLDPAWTTVDKRIFYACHDVTEQLTEGENVLGVMLGNGWYNPLPLRMWSRINIREHLTVGRPKHLTQLIIEYADGSTQRIGSDDSWRVSDGPLLRNSVYLGETYDARLEQPGWNRPGFDDAQWTTAVQADTPPPAILQASPMPPIRATKTIAAVRVTEVETGVYIFDLGQNFAGWARLHVRGPAGTTVRMRMGELLYDDGTLNPMTAVAGQIKGLTAEGDPRGGPGAPEIAWQANTYTLRGEGEEVYTPRFTFHGFRYVEVTGYPGTPDLNAIEGLRLNTDLESVGTFACSNERFNRIQEMVQWTLLSNVFSVQSDCPAREKFQYGGDIVASSEMALYNYDMSTFYAKAVIDHRDGVRGDGWFPETAPYVGIAAANYVDSAGPIGWGLAHPLLVAQLYQYYGDRRVVEDNFEAARTWVDLLEAASDNLIIDRCIGDHESLDPRPIALIATAQFHQAASMVADFAEILGRRDQVGRYRQLADRIRDAFVERFLAVGTGQFGSATQAAQAAALYHGLAPEDEVANAIRRMVAAVVDDHGGHVATGIFGTKYLLNELTRTGNADVAYAMVNQSTYPGWGHMLENGATTLWETWAQSDNVYSQNHPMFGSVSEWFFKCLGGMVPARDAVGYNRFVLAPFVAPDLDWVDASYASVRGRITCSWRVQEGTVEVTVDVPVNTEAELHLPTSDVRSVQEGGQPIADVLSVHMMPSRNSGVAQFRLGSGRYVFTAAA